MSGQGPPDERPADRGAALDGARALADDEGLLRARRMQRAGMLDRPSEEGEGSAAVPAGRPDGPRPISIWQPTATEAAPIRQHGFAFDRPPTGPLGDHHAARRSIPAAKPDGVKRAALLGESAAAGYLLAPHLTPAMALEAQLAELARGGAPSSEAARWEVVDLARTDERLGTLVATAEASLQLAPDCFVLYAGNNWALLETPELSPFHPSIAARQEIAAALAPENGGGGLAALSQLARRRTVERVAPALERLAAIARAAGIPVVAVIPDCALTVWESRQPVPWLTGDGVGRWTLLRDRCRRALAVGDRKGAEAAAWRMLELDGERVPASCQLLAAALAGGGGEGAGGGRRAALAAEAAIDAEQLATLAFLGAPRAGSAARTLLARGAERFGWRTVDQRALFRPRTDNALAGDRFFLDYCHLNAEGVARTMAAVAWAVARGRGEQAGSLPPADQLDRLAAASPALTPAAAATAHLGAAVHASHRMLAATPGALDRRSRRELTLALAAAPGAAAQALVDLADARTAALPEPLTAGQRRQLASPAPLGLAHGWRWGGLDPALLDLAAGLLVEAGFGREADEVRQLVDARCRLPPAGGAPPADLAAGERHLWSPAARFIPDAVASGDLPGRLALRAAEPELTLVLPAADLAAGGIDLELTARLPPIGGSRPLPGMAPGWQPPERRGTVTLLLDGEPVGRMSLGERWQRRRFRLAPPRSGGAPGDPGRRPLFHRLTLAWPLPPPVGEDALAAAARRLELGRDAELHPVYGEVARLTARRA